MQVCWTTIITATAGSRWGLDCAPWIELLLVGVTLWSRDGPRPSSVAQAAGTGFKSLILVPIDAVPQIVIISFEFVTLVFDCSIPQSPYLTGFISFTLSRSSKVSLHNGSLASDSPGSRLSNEGTVLSHPFDTPTCVVTYG